MAGPVHLDLAFREPLVGVVQELPPARAGGEPWLQAPTATVVAEADPAVAAVLVAAERGVIVAGRGTPVAEVLALAAALRWPILADVRSGLSGDGDDATVVLTGFDPVVRSEFGADHQPEVVVWSGERPASKVLGQWVAASGAVEVAVPGNGRWIDPASTIAHALHGPLAAIVGGLAAAVGGPVDRADVWPAAWAAAAAAASTAVDEVLVVGHAEPTEPGVARSVTRAASRADLVVSSSMPIRDAEWFGDLRRTMRWFVDPEVHGKHGVISTAMPSHATKGRVLSNRGANGIDGVTSTAVGVALANRGRSRPTALLIGDVAFLHDTNGLLGLARRGVDLTIVVVDNDGGGIFSFLPQRQSLTGDRFEQLFGTPHGVDLAALAAAHGLDVEVVDEAAVVGPAVSRSLADGGVRVVLVRTERDANVAVHAELDAAVAKALAHPR